MSDLSRSFGYQAVDPAERERRIRRVFDTVAPRYDLMNDLMSMGTHRLWKRAFARMAAARAGQVIVDLAGGTGDIAALMAGPDRLVAVCDPSVAMMAAGRRRGRGALAWLAGAGERLPFADDSVDTLTISFGIRNVTDMPAALVEIRRVLKPGGRFLCLEFSRPNASAIRAAYDAWSFNAIPAIGKAVTGDRDSYQYLVESIRRFPDQKTFARMITDAGFSRVGWTDYSGGVAALHHGWAI